METSARIEVLKALMEQRGVLDRQIMNIVDELAGSETPTRGRRTSSTAGAPKQKRKMSASARKRIAAAQKKRWADQKARKQTVVPTPITKLATTKKSAAASRAKVKSAGA